MRLNPDCIRDILLKLEEITDGKVVYDFDAKNATKLSNKCPVNEILYHLNICIENNFIKGRTNGNCYYVQDITLIGHTFLSDIRSDKNWNKVKVIANNIGSFSLDTLKEIAVGVITSQIKNLL
jgi:hypothetical protein